MDPSDQSEPLALTPAPHPYQEYVPGAIKPCTMHINDSGNKVASLFHLLTCGHVVALYDSDQRCGRNCQHMATLFPSQSLQGSNGSQAPHVIDSQLDSMDDLYCETCGGIPIDRYQRMQPLDHPKRLRQSYALTRAVLVSALGIDEYQLDAMLCSPLFSTNLPDFDWRSTHKLCCGHLVFSAPMRPCASNCALGSGCQSSLEPLNWREGDAILCQECVLRSDSVFKKFAKVEQVTKSPEDSGYGSAGPQSTSSFGDYGYQFDG